MFVVIAYGVDVAAAIAIIVVGSLCVVSVLLLSLSSSSMLLLLFVVMCCCCYLLDVWLVSYWCDVPQSLYISLYCRYYHFHHCDVLLLCVDSRVLS